MYQPVAPGLTKLNIKNINLPWKNSVEPIAREILKKGNPSLFNINGTKTYERGSPLQSSATNDRKLHSLSPILELCYDFNYGDMLQFIGGLGSKKTTTALNITKDFSEREGHTSIFVSTVSPA
jgi:hypothetical protein